MSTTAATTVRTVYGLIADAMTAHFHGDMLRWDKVVEQGSGDSDLAVCAFGTMVGMLRASGMSAARVRATAREILGPEPADPPPGEQAPAGKTQQRKPAEAPSGGRRAGS
jgi:hypothetical protein